MKNYIPYKHQTTAIKNIITTFKKEDRTQLIKSCGTGKSLTAMWTHEKFVSSLDESITLLFYPSLFLVNQTYNTYKENTILKFNPLVACSDTAIGENENDDIFELDINEVKYPVTTNIEDIKIYLQDKSIKDKIVFITYQSCELIGAALNELDMKADLGVFDEAHKTATANIESKFAFALKDENVPIAKRLFMTATPRHIKFDMDSEDDEEVEVFSMNNPELYGNIAYEYPMREAINDGIITDYKIVGILIDDKYIDSYTNKVKPYSEDVINEAKIKAINEAMNKYGLNKALIFNRDIAASKELEKYSNTSIFNKTIKHLDGSSKHAYREQVIKELKDNEQYVITNAKLFTEGVDLPIIDMIALFRNVKSEIDIIQTVGRVQRIDKNNPNKIGYILLPIFISDLENIDEEINNNKDLGYVYDVINSLKENDEQLRATLEFKKQNKSKSNKNNNNDSKIENPNFEINYISNDTLNSDEYIREINEKITYKIEAVILNKKGENKTEKEWKELFVQYIQENGIENLIGNTKYRKESIGNTLNRIRKKYNKATPEEQKKMREFWDCFPDEFLERKISENKTDNEWKELFVQYIKENGIDNFNSSTVWNNEKLGYKFMDIKIRHHKATSEKQKETRKFWDCFPENMWDKQLKTNDEWKELFFQYNKEQGIKNITTQTVWKDIKLGGKFADIKTIYNKANPKKQKEIREFWDCFPDGYLENRKIENKKTNDEWKELFVQYIKENGIDNFNSSTVWKDIKLGGFLRRIAYKYNVATSEKQKKIREFWDCFPENMWDKKTKTASEWKELYIQYDKEMGFENFNTLTIWNKENLGKNFSRLKKKYSQETPEEQKKMREFWDCFPNDFWNRKVPETKTASEWKESFVQYDKEIGLKNIKKRTIFKNEKLGSKFWEIKSKYNKATAEEQKKMCEFWNCFPESMWERKAPELKTNEEWKEIFIKFIDENGIDNLNTLTVYRDINVGNKLNLIKKIYNKATSEQQKEMREFWDCFPDNFWDRKR